MVNRSVATFFMMSILLFGGCFNASNDRKTGVDVSRIDFAEGDLVFRRGLGVKSEAVLSADTEGLYSHSGVVVRQDSSFRIVHLTPGERESGETVDRIKMDSPEEFFSADRAQYGAVYRLSDSTNIPAQAAGQALRLLQKGILFDHDYLLGDSTQMYCTEFVWYIYLLEGKDITNGSRSELYNVPMFSGIYILPSDIYKNGEFSLIYNF